MEDPWARPPEGVWSLTTVRTGEARELTIGFDQGVPVALDGRPLPLHELIVELNDIVGGYGWGRLDMVENRRVGIKSRETYEAPGALALIMAHIDLESICLERDLFHEKQRLEGRYADLVYDGFWYSPAASRRSTPSSTRASATSPVRSACGSSRAGATSSAGAATTASTTTGWPPTRPRTRSTTPTRRAS